VTGGDWIAVELLSATTVGGGDPLRGEVDVEVEHDELGLPRLGGKALHSLLRDSWLSMADLFPELTAAAGRVLGRPRQLLGNSAVLGIGNATVDEVTRTAVARAQERGPQHHPLRPADVLHALTDVRVQTAQDRGSGAPLAGSLRRTRVVLPDLTWSAPLEWAEAPQPDDLRCLAMCLLATRHIGLTRWRGRGHARMTYRGDLAGTIALVQEATA
jgi:hypothetical protein